MVLLLVFMQLTRDLFAIAKFLLSYAADKQRATRPLILMLMLSSRVGFNVPPTLILTVTLMLIRNPIHDYRII